MKKIKMIWDFRGPNATMTAKHHVTHLNEYFKLENLHQEETGHEVVSDMHTLAFVVVYEKDMRKVRDDLKPHRGTLHS